MAEHVQDLPQGTKRDIVVAAGELFAEHGLEGASVRTIAKKAGVHIAAINYHFGSKENLYLETLRYVVLCGGDVRPGWVPLDDARMNSTEGLIEIIHEVVKEHFEAYFSPDHPEWHVKLIFRSFLEPSQPMHVLTEELFKPDQEALRELFHRARPDLTALQTRLWAITLTGQIAMFLFCKAPILTILAKDTYDPEFIEAAARHVAQTTVDALGLARSERITGDAAAPDGRAE